METRVLGQESRDRTARTGQPGLYGQDRTIRTGQPEQDSSRGQSDQSSQGRTARTGQLGQDIYVAEQQQRTV